MIKAEMFEGIPVHMGSRGNDFKNMLHNVFKRSKLNNKFTQVLLTEDSLKLYDQVFTHSSIDPVKNYEFYEILGDATLNKNIVWYISRRFPQLRKPEGVKIIARLKINLVSKENYSEISQKLGFWDYISADAETRHTKMKPTLEDVFEAFFGATENILDEKIRFGVGGEICRQIIYSLFDEIQISLKYYDLYDSKTILKENIDFIRSKIKNEQENLMFALNEKSKIVYNPDNRLKQKQIQILSVGNMSFDSERFDEEQITKVKLFIPMKTTRGNIKIYLGQGSGSLKPKAEQMASKESIQILKSWGISKPIPEIYDSLDN